MEKIKIYDINIHKAVRIPVDVYQMNFKNDTVQQKTHVNWNL